MLTIRVEPAAGWTAGQRREFAAAVTGAARELLGADVWLELSEDGPPDAGARRAAAVLAASWSGC